MEQKNTNSNTNTTEANTITKLNPVTHELPCASPPILNQNGIAFLPMHDKGNDYALKIGDKYLNNLIRTSKQFSNGDSRRKIDVDSINEDLTAFAEMSNKILPVYSRVAPLNESDRGIEIDIGDSEQTRVRVRAGQIEILNEGSQTLFYRPSYSLPMVIPASQGNLDLLKNYVNLAENDYLLLIAWLSYTLAHPKTKTSKYVILVILSEEGSGKSFLCRAIINKLIDPSQIVLQKFPKNDKDLVIAAQNSHLLCYDNLRDLSPDWSDTLCMASTGGTLSSRALYTNDDLHTNHLHVALVLNGIHQFIHEPDLAQRCLKISTKPLSKNQRRSEEDLESELENDMPAIFRGLLELIAKVFAVLPRTSMTNSQRMYDFSRWLAAMEIIDRQKIGSYQDMYEGVLNDTQIDALLDNLLAATIVAFTQTAEFPRNNKWSGTPTMLWENLMELLPNRVRPPKEWPGDPSSLTKKLASLKVSLLKQGIKVESYRAKERQISVELLDTCPFRKDGNQTYQQPVITSVGMPLRPSRKPSDF